MKKYLIALVRVFRSRKPKSGYAENGRYFSRTPDRIAEWTEEGS